MRVIFLVDGFNMYHSILTLQRTARYAAKWLDLHSLCKSYVHLWGSTAVLTDVYYFSALPLYLTATNPDKINRHRNYIRCLEHTGVKVELGRFKEKDSFCRQCKATTIKHEEKETDVAIAVKPFELFLANACDMVVIMSGDTDLVPAIETLTQVYGNKKIVFAFPYARKSKELAKLAPGSFEIGKKQYINHLLPDPVKTVRGDISKPVHW